MAELLSLSKAAEICSILCLLFTSSLRNSPYLGISAKTLTRGKYHQLQHLEVLSQALVRDSFHVGKGLVFSEESIKKSSGQNLLMEFVNVFMRIGFDSTIELVSFDESQVVTFNGKFGNEKVTEVIDVENWRVDNSRLLRWIVSLFEWNSYPKEDPEEDPGEEPNEEPKEASKRG
ncbi:hypothetical protein Tco_1074667 [Tanacetum coccineum]